MHCIVAGCCCCCATCCVLEASRACTAAQAIMIVGGLPHEKAPMLAHRSIRHSTVAGQLHVLAAVGSCCQCFGCLCSIVHKPQAEVPEQLHLAEPCQAYGMHIHLIACTKPARLRQCLVDQPVWAVDCFIANHTKSLGRVQPKCCTALLLAGRALCGVLADAQANL